MSRVLTLGVLATLILAAQPARAADPLPWEDTLIASWTGTGSHWIAIRAEVGEGRLFVAMEERGTARAYGTGAVVYDAAGALVAMFSHVHSGARLPRSYAQLGDAAFVVPPPIDSPFGPAGSGVGLGWGYNGRPFLEPGEYVIALWAGAPETSWTAEVRGTATFVPLAITEGSSAHLLLGEDMRGLASLGTSSSSSASGVGGGGAPVVGGSGVAARAQVDASATIEVAGRLVGTYEAQVPFALGGTHTGVEDLRIVNAAGERACAPSCALDDDIVGAWVFRATGAAIGTPESTTIALNAADVTWP